MAKNARAATLFATILIAASCEQCDPGGGDPHGTGTVTKGSETSSTTGGPSSEATSESESTTSSSASDSSETSDGDGTWAIGGWHYSYEDHGEVPTYGVRKYLILEDGTTKQIRLFCGGEIEYQGVWYAVGTDKIRIEPPDGESKVSIPGGGLYEAIEIKKGDTCDMAFEIPIKDDMTQELPWPFTRGDMCLNCSNEGPDQLQWCDLQPPAPCE